MKIEAPDNLSELTAPELDLLEDRVDELRIAIRVHRRANVTSAVAAVDDRPAWALTLSSLLDSKANRYGIAIVLLVIFSIPSTLQSCGAIQQNAAHHVHGDK